jgi:hypothetical protein
MVDYMLIWFGSVYRARCDDARASHEPQETAAHNGRFLQTVALLPKADAEQSPPEPTLGAGACDLCCLLLVLLPPSPLMLWVHCSHLRAWPSAPPFPSTETMAASDTMSLGRTDRKLVTAHGGHVRPDVGGGLPRRLGRIGLIRNWVVRGGPVDHESASEL